MNARCAAERQQTYRQLCETFTSYTRIAAQLGIAVDWAGITISLVQDAVEVCHTWKNCSRARRPNDTAVTVTLDGATPVELCQMCASTPQKISVAHATLDAVFAPIADTIHQRRRRSTPAHHNLLAAEAAAGARRLEHVDASSFAAAWADPPSGERIDANLETIKRLSAALIGVAAAQYQAAGAAVRDRSDDETAALHAELLGADHPRWTSVERRLLAGHAAGTVNADWLADISTTGLEATIQALTDKHSARYSQRPPYATADEIAGQLHRAVRAATNGMYVVTAHPRTASVELVDAWPQRSTDMVQPTPRFVRQRTGSQTTAVLQHSWIVAVMPAAVAAATRDIQNLNLCVSDVTSPRPSDLDAACDQATEVFCCVLGGDDTLGHVTDALDAAAALLT